MRLRINPWRFLGKLVVLLLVSFLLWAPLAPYYARFLLHASQLGVWLTEFSTDPTWNHPTQLLIKPEISPTALLFYNTRFPQFSSGIPAEWVMASLVLLVPLMLATPAATWRQRIGRLAAALAAALVLQVFDVVVGVKVFYATSFPERWGPAWREMYQFLDAFVQSWDTQLFPFLIWAGIHLPQLLPAAGRESAPAPASERAPLARGGTRAERRRQGSKQR
jgi:hypothetical protein